MDKLLKKYLDGKINPDEITNLRELPDSLLSESILEDWNNFMDQNSPGKKGFSWRKIFGIGAAAMLAILMATTMMLWHRTNVLSSQDVVISTRGNGERANVTLPDGSTVTLNSNSSLSYKPEDFTGGNRSVIFEGEAFFNITKNEKNHFMVRTSLVDVDVKGTTFNLLSRDKECMASLYLETGSVELCATKSGAKIDMKPGDFVQLDADGTGFLQGSKENGRASSAWRRGEYIFINRPLKDVIKSLECNSDTTISLEDTDLETIYFTGTLPAGDLLEALHILELSCGLKIDQTEHKIILSSK